MPTFIATWATYAFKRAFGTCSSSIQRVNSSLTSAARFYRFNSVKVPLLRLTGNPVKIGSGPAAVIPPCCRSKAAGNPFGLVRRCPGISRAGRLLKGAGKPEDLP